MSISNSLWPQTSVKLLVGGKLLESKTDKWINNYNPATQEVVSRVPCATQVWRQLPAAHGSLSALLVGGDERSCRGSAECLPSLE